MTRCLRMLSGRFQILFMPLAVRKWILHFALFRYQSSPHLVQAAKIIICRCDTTSILLIHQSVNVQNKFSCKCRYFRVEFQSAITRYFIGNLEREFLAFSLKIPLVLPKLFHATNGIWRCCVNNIGKAYKYICGPLLQLNGQGAILACILPAKL